MFHTDANGDSWGVGKDGKTLYWHDTDKGVYRKVNKGDKSKFTVDGNTIKPHGITNWYLGYFGKFNYLDN